MSNIPDDEGRPVHRDRRPLFVLLQLGPGLEAVPGRGGRAALRPALHRRPAQGLLSQDEQVNKKRGWEFAAVSLHMKV